MKTMPSWKKMSLFAGITYGVLAILQMFVWRGIFNNIQIAFSALPVGWAIEFFLILLSVLLCIHYLKKEAPVSNGEVQALFGGSLLLIIFVVFTYTGQIEIINFSLPSVFPSLADNKIVQLVLILARMVLVILGAFFAMNATAAAAAEEELLNTETAIEELEEIAEEVMNELEEEESSEK